MSRKQERTDPAFLEWRKRWDEYSTLRMLLRREYIRQLKEIAKEFPEDSLMMPQEPVEFAAERMLAEVYQD